MKGYSSADERAVIKAINPAKRNDKITEGPASPAATPLTTKIPAPIIFAIPTEAAPNSPTFRLSFDIVVYWKKFGRKILRISKSILITFYHYFAFTIVVDYFINQKREYAGFFV